MHDVSGSQQEAPVTIYLGFDKLVGRYNNFYIFDLYKNYYRSRRLTLFCQKKKKKKIVYRVKISLKKKSLSTPIIIGTSVALATPASVDW